MNQIIASVFLDILLSYAIGNDIFCIFKNFEINFIKIGQLRAVKEAVREIMK